MACLDSVTLFCRSADIEICVYSSNTEKALVTSSLLEVEKEEHWMGTRPFRSFTDMPVDMPLVVLREHPNWLRYGKQDEVAAYPDRPSVVHRWDILEARFLQLRLVN
eukprot:CAMPEP_0194156204 /NCGR_PEP_ID=MMETSP0152-20130528/67427_1 /TAXON_ID=1049557 /ORGANISM="Thalassiothrix antarctica, Strain L6-D1" /LENGTH=106 /DNA_ID=CAMNT_0038863707 /DNA_START=109 /DNA_END=430 /DNA_ORIENTATION=+